MIDTDAIMQLALDMAGFSEVPTDSGIWVSGRNVRKVLIGIDIGTAELRIAQQMGFDLVIAHHPPEATLEAWRCYLRHVDFMESAGVPRALATKTVAKEVEMMQLRAHGRNYEHTISVARMLGMPFMNIHTPLDEIARLRMRECVMMLESDNPRATVGDLVDALEVFDEVKNAPVPVLLAHGIREQSAGNVLIAHAALDVPNYAMFAACYGHGVDSIISLRVGYNDLQKLREDTKGALVVLGHNAGDSLGIVPFIHSLEQKGLTVVPISGIIID